MKKIVCMLLVIVMITSMMISGISAYAENNIELRLQTPPVFAVGYMDALKDAVARYESEHSNVKISIEELNWDGIGDKLEAAMMTGSTPDIYIDGTARTAKLPRTELVVDVTDVINSLDNWVESATAIGQIDGKNYLVPMTQMPPTVLGINKTLAQKYGVYDMLPEDRVSWTWDDFMAFLRACGEKSVADGVYPISLYAGSQSSDIAYYSMMLAAGAQILNEDHSASAVNNEAAVSVLGYLKQMVDEGLAYPGAATMTDDDEQPLFFSNKAVVSLTMNGALSVFPVVSEMLAEGIVEEVCDFEAYGYPHLNGSETANATWGANCIAIFENEGDQAKIAAAKDFICFLMDDISFSEALWNASPAYAPTRNIGQVLDTQDERIKREAEVNNMLGAYNTSSFGILEPFWAEIRQYFYPELQALFTGTKTAEDAITSFDSNINQVIASY